MMRAAPFDPQAVERVRERICRDLSRTVTTHRGLLRVRIHLRDGMASEAWFYTHTGKGWRKSTRTITGPDDVQALEETLAMLVSRRQGDVWSARQHAATDYRDTDLKVHVEKLKSRSQEQLPSLLAGLLFRDAHDSKKDVRRTIRTPR